MASRNLPYRADPTYWWGPNPQPQSWARFGLREQLVTGHKLVSNRSNNRARLMLASPQKLPTVMTANHPTTIAVRSLEIGAKARRQGYGRRR